MKNILFYYPSNQRTISIESVIIEFKKQGHNVVLLTQTEFGDLHVELKSEGINCFTNSIMRRGSLFYYIKQMNFLVKFCKKNEIDIVYSHLQQANIISVFAQYFCRAKFYICRHHSTTNGADRNFFQTLFDKIINKLAKLIIVPSDAVYKQVNRIEGVPVRKIKLIPYGYNFDKYPKPNLDYAAEIKEKYKCKLLLVKIARLVPGKRYDILLKTLKKLIKEEGLSIKLLIISDGPQKNEIQAYINSTALENSIFLLGNRKNVIDYLYASDIVPLLSEAEASNSVIKEAGLVGKCVIVCREVGDFEEYIKHGISGLLIDREKPGPDLEESLVKLYDGSLNSKEMGNELYKSVMEKFSIENVVEHYTVLNR